MTGEISSRPAGCGRPSRFRRSANITLRVPPAESPAITIPVAGTPRASNASDAAKESYNAAGDGVSRQVVPDGHGLDRAGRADGEARGLDGLREQAVDLSGDGGGGGVALLGEHVVALPAARELGEPQLVVAQACADGRRRSDGGGPRPATDAPGR